LQGESLSAKTIETEQETVVVICSLLIDICLEKS